MAHHQEQWFDGEVLDVKYFDPTLPGDSLAKQAAAFASAVSKATARVNARYAVPCQDDSCAARSGIYSFNVGLQFKKLRKRHAVVCEVLWLLCVSCDGEQRISESAPAFTADWNMLNRNWVRFLQLTGKGGRWKYAVLATKLSENMARRPKRSHEPVVSH